MAEPLEQAALYREAAEKLRKLAAKIRFDLCRCEQLRALADGFDRLADRIAQPERKAAD